MQVAFLQSYYC